MLETLRYSRWSCSSSYWNKEIGKKLNLKPRAKIKAFFSWYRTNNNVNGPEHATKKVSIELI